MARRTLAEAVEVTGIGLHTGVRSVVRLLPAAGGAGIVFRREDLPEQPIIPARIAQVDATERRTSLAYRDARVDTVEHLLAALYALEYDDALIAIDGPEPPMLDGSFEPWIDALTAAGSVEVAGEPTHLRVAAAFTLEEGGASYVVAPAPQLAITATVEWNHPSIGRQSLRYQVAPDTFGAEIGRARTFGFVHELEGLQQRGLLRGATPDMAVVLSDTGLASGSLRFPDEFVRHKLGDILGDLSLLGARVDAHVVAERPSHQGNIALARALAHHGERSDAAPLDAVAIAKVLPHRYPFLLVDRILGIEPGVRITGLKNVTINEPFFSGHFPGHPIMPGVLIVEAMAQVGGMLALHGADDHPGRLVYFTGLNDVRFRKPVVPGDQLRFEVELVQRRGPHCRLRGRAFVAGQVVCEAVMMARLADP